MTQANNQTYMIDGVKYIVNREFSKEKTISDILFEIVTNHSNKTN